MTNPTHISTDDNKSDGITYWFDVKGATWGLNVLNGATTGLDCDGAPDEAAPTADLVAAYLELEGMEPVDLVLTSIEADGARETDTNTRDGIDVDFTLTLPGGETLEGEVTLIPGRDSGHYGSWGDADHWINSDALAAMRHALGDDLGQVLSELSGACVDVADKFRDENPAD